MSTPRGPRSAFRGGGRTRPGSGMQSRGGAPATRTGLQGRISNPIIKENGSRNTSIRGRASTNTGRNRHSVSKPSPLSRVQTVNPEKESWRDPTVVEFTEYKAHMAELWNSLKQKRDQERKDAIKNGFLSDPDKPTSLANAITPVGTCQDMCPEYERVQRISHHGDIDRCEKTAGPSPDSMVPYEDYMVKKFRRSSPGDEQQLPSDIRPPLVLQKTLNYLFDSVIGGSRPLADVHKFVWDRTRSIRNDFSIQQVTKTEDLRLAIDCFEKIARFHILSLHQLSYQDKGEFDAHQEREQLNNTLLSLMYYYDDSRSKLSSPNEAEFRAYCIIFEIQSQRPDLEDRAQSWPIALLKDPRIQTALKLHAAAGNTSDSQGPLRPPTAFSIAQANYVRFWTIVTSNAVPYLMACTAEIYFNFVRSIALRTIWKAYRRGGAIKLEDWVMSDVMKALAFDTEEQATTFCEEHGFTVGEREDGNSFLNLSSVSGRPLTDSNPRRGQIFSKTLVEQKRLGRTFTAIINGTSAFQARANSLVENPRSGEVSPSTNPNEEPLFVTDEDTPLVPVSDSPLSTSIFVTTPEAQNPPSQVHDPKSQSQGPIGSIFNGKPVSTLLTPAPTSSPVPSGSTTLSPTSSRNLQLTVNSSAPSFGQSSTTTTSQPASIFAQATDPAKSNFMWRTAFDPSTPTSLPVSTPTALFESTQDGSKTLFNSLPIPNTTQPINARTQVQSHVSPFAYSNSIFEPQSGSINKPVPSDGASALATPFTFGSPGQKPAVSFPFSSQPAISGSVISPTSSSALGTQPALCQPSFTFNATNPAAQASIREPKSKLFQPSIPFSFATTSAVLDSKLSNSPSFNTVPRPSSSQLPAFPSHPTSISSFPGIRKEASNLSNSSNTSTSGFTFLKSSSSSSNQIKSAINQTTNGPPKPDRRPQTLDQLANVVVCENDGILQQFIEHTIGPAIVKSMSKVKRERENAEIARVQGILLGKKYFRRWKEIAWKRGLMRKGKERRRNFAQSMQALSQSTMQALNIRYNSQASPDPESRDQSLTMRPPERSTNLPHKRKSLPNGYDHGNTPQSPHRSHLASQHDPSAESSNIAQHRPKKSHHKRSSTLDSVSLISSSSINSRAQFNPMSSFPGSTSLLSDSVLKKARRLVPAGPTDTTRTDYFRLKAMGIDPDTPVVPATRKRRISDHEEVNPKRASRPPPPIASTSTTRPAIQSTSKSSEVPITYSITPTKADDSDEDLFAQVRQVKAAMSESMSWYREERQKSELSRSSSISHDRPSETDAERRLREFKHTPSRTKIRLQQTGAHGLLPKNWDMRNKTNGTAEVMKGGETPTRPRMGFATVGANGVVTAKGRNPEERQVAGVGTGASADDAIEL